MTAEDWKRVQEIVEDALRRDPEERPAFLDQACAGKPKLREAVEALLAQAEESDGATSVRPGGPSSARKPRQEIPQRIGPYIIHHEIARGGMGVVYLAEDTRLGRRVALKALPGVANLDPQARARLRREARAAAALLHPGIAAVFALEEIDDQLFLASEYVPGHTLRSLLANGPLSPHDLVNIATQLAQALAAAHAHGIVHRDLKPENIMVSPTWQAKVLDFGIAQMENLTSTRLTDTGTIVGTPAYMAPEQAEALDVDFRSDLFAFGVVLYEMATGKNPFEARTAKATITRILSLEPQPLSSLRPELPAELDALVDRCLRKQPAERYATTQELVAELDALASGTRGPNDPVRIAIGSASPGDHPRRSSGYRPIAGSIVHAWWEIHQVAVMALYIAATAWAWRLGEWYRTTIPPWIFVAAGVGAMVAGTTRGHLVFTERFNPDSLDLERKRTSMLLTATDVLIGMLLVADGLFATSMKPTLALLTMIFGVAVVLLRVIVEPATESASFGSDERGTNASGGNASRRA